jgi:predicted DNA-binding transcriptional regulator AlpA
MSLHSQALIFETYGPRLSMDQLAQVLGVSKQSLYNQISAATCPVRTYLDGGRRFADYRDLAEHLDACRARAA